MGNPCANLVPLAVSAIDVGFVGALAALAAAVLTPLSNWLVTIATHKHERRLAHDERAFDARRDAFEEAVVQVHHSLAVARHYYARFADPTFPLADLDRGSVGETIELAGRIGVVGTPELISAIDDASNASFAFFKATGPVLERLKASPPGATATPQELSELKPLLDDLAARRDAVAKIARSALMASPR